MTQDKTQLRTTFDQDALLYDQARPGYPEALFDDIVTLSDLPPDGRLLEIGCGTGQATLPLARRGYHILSVELGANMAALARRNLAAYPRVSIHTEAFEDWQAEEEAFDLAFSATAFHWIDPAISYPKIARILKPSGSIALFWHVHVQSEASQGFFEEVQQIYQPLVPEQGDKYGPLLWPHAVPEPVKAEIEQTGLFRDVAVRRYHWDVSYDAASYLRLLDTYSNHRILEKDRHDRLFDGIADLINTRYHGRITKGYLAILYVARRK
ncbi:class I SAM-dependent methyltransferase [Dictyobacter aurantiacus]|uniref:Methyltransferase type 11 n=1 Tax=Dictyobacter aurantiacus TaxID=1936993 RepID=A0A401ZIW3_9CHLR|nr:class I SAM-dependent methyltransferase [Dictyobacter aurantiacus]GCE06782.1 methyltransferase type 11 [Dictyobacter aurantiacus]